MNELNIFTPFLRFQHDIFLEENKAVFGLLPTAPWLAARCRLPLARLARCSSLLIGSCIHIARLSTEIVWLPAQLAANSLFSYARSSFHALHEPGPVGTPESYVSSEPGSSGTVAWAQPGWRVRADKQTPRSCMPSAWPGGQTGIQTRPKTPNASTRYASCSFSPSVAMLILMWGFLLKPW